MREHDVCPLNEVTLFLPRHTPVTLFRTEELGPRPRPVQSQLPTVNRRRDGKLRDGRLKFFCEARRKSFDISQSLPVVSPVPSQYLTYAFSFEDTRATRTSVAFYV
ncbi:hypothetical protein EVAR_99385_1 [Eumeta japonica]|uniref:Uncharacterized protein n=1 Tax=Eumeta variegata TaxID=151549 RepID=A0A4C1YR84_EUMVA|nr:hypothetical protein EVAR_99385_1 [Eumeta japonica]